MHELRLVYFTPAETKVVGFIETDHYGVRFPNRGSHIDLTSIAQQWLRDLVWDYPTALLQSPRCPRTRGVIDGIRRAAIELGAFLTIDAPDGGHDPTVLDGEHMSRLPALEQRARLGARAALELVLLAFTGQAAVDGGRRHARQQRRGVVVDGQLAEAAPDRHHLG